MMLSKKTDSMDDLQTANAIAQVKAYLLDLQNRICDFLTKEDGKEIFIEDAWNYTSGNGGGITRVLENGGMFEKAGVNFSHVYGASLPKAATQKRPELANSPFQALGVSVVVHPNNPFVPTSHFNIRFIVVEPKERPPIWWFGGGFDLTPYYAFTEDCKHWHQMAKAACDPFGEELYPKFKKWADDYFYLPHRKEARGIGGIFFDDFHPWNFEPCFSFLKSVGEHYIKAYQPIVNKRKFLPFTQKQREFQLYRRGRYVEFNLLYDRGTLFGLQSGGRTESIFMSLPPAVNWRYKWAPAPGSLEAALYDHFLVAKDWI